MATMTDLLRTVRKWVLIHKLRTAFLALVFALTVPWPARAQLIDPCCAVLAAGLASIQSALTNIIGGGLSQILAVDQTMQQYQQTIVWPQNLIAQTESLVGALQSNFRQMQSLSLIPVSSATLPTSQQLEKVLLSRDPNSIGQTADAYTALYGPIPAATAGSQQVLNIIDMTDAVAEAAMKRAIEMDALADLEIQVANELNQSIQSAAPGTVPIIEAQTDAWLIRALAYTQSATADLMRLRSIDLANASADIKLAATNTTGLRHALANLLQHQ